MKHEDVSVEHQESVDEDDEFRSGVVAVVGRPNVGKSTLVNAIVRARVAITSPRPQTTRGRLFGVRTTPDYQIAFVDTPGYHRGKTLLNRAMLGVVREESEGADRVLFVVDGSRLPQKDDVDAATLLMGGRSAANASAVPSRSSKDARAEASPPGDEFADMGAEADARAEASPPGDEFADMGAEADEPAEASPPCAPSEGPARVLEPRVPVLLVVNKTDLVDDPEVLASNIEAYRRLGVFCEVFEVSAASGRGLAPLERALASALPPGPQLFPEDMVTDQDERVRITEMIREKALLETRQEVPHAIAVEVEELREGRSPGTRYVRATIYVEKDSQKAIVVGKGGMRLKRIGQMARTDIAQMLGTRVYLDLWVKVKEDWRERKDVLRAWGFNV